MARHKVTQIYKKFMLRTTFGSISSSSRRRVQTSKIMHLCNFISKINSNIARFLKNKEISRKVKERAEIYIDGKIKLKYIST